MRRRGFTLIEIMVATTILGIIMLTVYGVLARSLYAKNHAEERADLYASGREVVLRIADELEAALPPSAGRRIGFVGVPGNARVPTDAVQFDVVVRRLYGASQARGGRALVSYSLDPMKDPPNLFALRRQEEMLTEAMVDDRNAEEGQAEAPAEPVATAAYIADHVAGLRVRYLDAETGEWGDSWDTTVETPGRAPRGLPGAVEVTVFLADNSGGVHDFGTIADLPLANLAPTPRR